MKTVFIYALKDPDTGQIRYVGMSANPEKRLYQHLRDQRKNHRTSWIKSLCLANLMPVLVIVDEVPEDYWRQMECAYIEFFRECGCDLVNGTDGGECGPVGVLKGRKLSDAWRHALSIAHMGLPSGAKGKPHSEEAKEKNRKAHLGNVTSAGTRQKQRVAHLGKKHKDARSSFVGVTLAKKLDKKNWMARWDGHFIGYFETEQEAANAVEDYRLCPKQ